MIVPVRPHNRQTCPLCISENIRDQPRRSPRPLPEQDRHLSIHKPQIRRLDQRLLHIGVVRHHVQPHRSIPGERPEPRLPIRDRQPRDVSSDPGRHPVADRLLEGHLLDGALRPGAENEVGLVVEDGPDQLRDLGAVVLAVSVGVDDDVRTHREGGLEAGPEARCEALVLLEADDRVGTGTPGFLDRPIRRAVIDDEDFDGVDTGDGPGNLTDDGRDRLFFIVGRDHYDEFHGVPLFRESWSAAFQAAFDMAE